MKKYAIMTITLFAMLALTIPLYAAGDMEESSKKQHESSAAMDDQSKNKEQQTVKEMEQAGTKMKHAGTTPTAEELQGMEVYSQQGEEIGNIEEVAVNDQSGEIKFVTLSKGGILGIGDKEIPVPLEALSFEGDRATLIVDTSKLENVPDQGNVSADQFQRDLQSHYGLSPAWDQDSAGTNSGKSSMKEDKGEDGTMKSKSILDDSDSKKSKSTN